MLAEFGTGQVLWSMIWFFVFVIWISLLLSVFADIFRSRDLGGLATFAWCLFVIVLPYLGVFIYLIARGQSMNSRTVQARSGGGAPTDELARLAALRDQGVIDDTEFRQMKAKIVG